MKIPAIAEIWTHYKGGQYVIAGFCWDAAGPSLVLCVLYHKVDDAETVFCRSLDNFLEPIGGSHEKRFQYEGAHADDLVGPRLD